MYNILFASVIPELCPFIMTNMTFLIVTEQYLFILNFFLELVLDGPSSDLEFVLY